MSKQQSLDQLREGLQDPSHYKSPSSRKAAKWRLKCILAGLCLSCGMNPTESNKRRCRECSIKWNSGRDLRESSKAWRKVRFEAGFCTYCGKNPHAEDRKLCESCLSYWRKKSGQYHKADPAAWNARCKKSYEKLKRETFEAYGGLVCACCGETVAQFLTLDHRENDGAEHRRAVFQGARGGGIGVYRWLRKNNYPPGYQVLCWNCNCGKRMNNGVCPHKQT